MSNLDKVLSRLDMVKRIGDGRYKALCPAHDDRTPSLAIKDADGRILLHCFCGCETIDVLGAIGLDFTDIMPEEVKGNFK
jgi:DNA primase